MAKSPAAIRNLAQLRDLLTDLRAARAEAFKAGDFDRCDYLQLCIDDTRDLIARAEA